MFKLLVNSPSGLQEVIEIDWTGVYLDSGTVVWDERVDGSLPDNTIVGAMVKQGNLLTVDSTMQAAYNAAILIGNKSVFIQSIDNDCDSIINAVIGRRETEYITAEAQARAYVAAGYTGTVPDYVQNWATVKKQTAQWAADDIVNTSNMWRSSQETARFNRLQHKEDARNAATQTDLDAVITSWNTFVSTLKSNLGL